MDNPISVDNWITIFHEKCGGPAFLYEHEPQLGELMRSELARHLDGSAIDPSTHPRMCCESCGMFTSVHELFVDGRVP